MKKIFFAFCILLITCCLLPIDSSAQDSTKVDTIPAVLIITNSKYSKPQPVPGYVLQRNGTVVGYLSRLKKTFPKKITVWQH